MPTAISILQRLHQHCAWANEKLVEAAATLSADELRQPFDIGQKDLPQRHGDHGEYQITNDQIPMTNGRNDSSLVIGAWSLVILSVPRGYRVRISAFCNLHFAISAYLRALCVSVVNSFPTVLFLAT
jgi:hypothetical protein